VALETQGLQFVGGFVRPAQSLEGPVKLDSGSAFRNLETMAVAIIGNMVQLKFTRIAISTGHTCITVRLQCR
jgi:hypothetical protein